MTPPDVFAGPFVALAHRGGADFAPNRGRENTLAAFAAAVDLGYTHLETDVHVTADGVLVAFHDEVLDRVSDASGALADLPWSEVSRARVGTEPIPRLADLLEAFPEARFNLDLKAPGAVEPLARTLRQHGAEARVCVGSFGEDRLRRFRRLVGDRVATSVGPRGVVAALTPGPWPRRRGPHACALQVPTDWPLPGGRRLQVVTPRFVAGAHARGQLVHVWTVDEADEMERLLDLGVDGLISDRIDVLREVLLARGWWQGPS